MTTISSLSGQAAWPSGGAVGAQNVLIADLPNANGKVTDTHLGAPVVATAPDGSDRQATLTQRLYSYGETRYYVDGVGLGQQFKTEKAARAEVARRIGAGTMGALPLAPRQKTRPEQTRVRALAGSDGTVQTAGGGNNTVVELAVREEMRKGRWQVTGYVATKISKYSIESFADSAARTEYGYPLASQTKNTLIRTPTGGVVTDLAQAHQRTRELVASRSLTTVSAAEVKELSGATRLEKPVAAMNNLDRVKYLLQETVRRLPASVASELKASLTSPETLLMMGAFCAAQAVPGLNVAALIVGSLLLGNDILDTGGKMVDAVKSALSASSQAELVSAGKNLAEALGHGAVSVASAAVGNRVGKAWKNMTSAEATSLRELATTVKNYKAGTATPEQVRRAAIVAMQEKRAAAANANAGKEPTTSSPQTPTPTPTARVPVKRPSTSKSPPRQTMPDPAVTQAAAAQRAIGKAAEGVFTDEALQSQLSQRLAKDPRTNPSKNATASIDPQTVQASATQLLMPKLIQSVFGGRKITKTATEAFTARATAWARQESPSNPAGALERLAGSSATQAALLRQTVLDQLTGSSAASIKALGRGQPAAGRAIAARRERLTEILARTYPDAPSQAQLLQPNAGSARTAVLRAQAGAELGGSTPLASAIEAQLKAKGTGERDLVNLTSSPQARISTMKNALVERWQGSSGREPLLDGKSQRNLRTAIDGQLANIPGDLAKEQHLKDLAASGQTVARMAKGEPDARSVEGKVKVKKQATAVPANPAQGAAVPVSTARRPGESMHDYLKRMNVKQSLSAEQQRVNDATGMRMSNTPRKNSAADSGSQVPPNEGQLFKARGAALQRDLAAADVAALPQAVLQADTQLLSSLGREELAKLRTRLAPQGVELAEGVPKTEASFKALARLDTAALSGPLLRTVGFDFTANPLLNGSPTLTKAARGLAIRSLAAGQDPTRVVEDLNRLFVGRFEKKTGALIEGPLWTTLEAAQALPRDGPARRKVMDYALATYYRLSRLGDAEQASATPQWIAGVRSYAEAPSAQRPAAPWPAASWNGLNQHLLFDKRLAQYNQARFGGGGVPNPYDWPGASNTKREQQKAAGITPAYERNPSIRTKAARTAFSNPIYDSAFGGKNIERVVIGIKLTELPGYAEIQAFLRKRNMTLKDWDRGLATAADGSEVRIQAELQSVMKAQPRGSADYIHAETKLQDFNDRFVSTDRVVLTRNPYDLMTISTGRGPKNCLTMEPTKPGNWSQTLAGSITEGSLGVYVTKSTDPTLARPRANTIVNPYRAVSGSGDVVLSGNYTFFGRKTAMPDGVVQQIADHMDASFNAGGQRAGQYRIDPNVYAERLIDIWVP